MVTALVQDPESDRRVGRSFIARRAFPWVLRIPIRRKANTLSENSGRFTSLWMYHCY